jgi:hypothetical protein
MTTGTAPQLLNDDGTASLATAFMTSHFAFRRDLARFATALARPSLTAAEREALSDEWESFHLHLHGHHEAEDNGMFPNLAAQNTAVAVTIDELGAEHRRIDPLLERGDRAFAKLDGTIGEAIAVVRALQDLLGPHLAREEAELIPFLRLAKSFPPPPDEAALAMYAEGFAWSTQGVAADVLDQLYAILPDALRKALPAAQAAFQARCDRVWGPLTLGAARTPIPDV